MRQYLSHCALFAGAVAPALIVGNFDVALRLCARVLFGMSLTLISESASDLMSDCDDVWVHGTALTLINKVYWK